MKITIAASIRLLFILTLVAISVAAQSGLIEQGPVTLDRGDRDTAIEKVAAHNSGERTRPCMSVSAPSPKPAWTTCIREITRARDHRTPEESSRL